MNSIATFVKAWAKDKWHGARGGKGEFSGLTQQTALVFENDLGKDVCDKLIADIESVLAEPNHPRVWKDAIGADSRILGFERDIGDLIKNLEIDRRLEAIEEYLGVKIRSWYLMANRVLAVENNLGSGGGWHRDSPYSHEVKCIWYLSDVKSENGPFEFVPGTHVNAIERREDYPLGVNRFDALKEEEAPVEVTAGAGSLLVCDTKCIHRGKPIRRGVRYAVTIYTSPNADDKRRRVINIAD